MRNLVLLLVPQVNATAIVIMLQGTAHAFRDYACLQIGSLIFLPKGHHRLAATIGDVPNPAHACVIKDFHAPTQTVLQPTMVRAFVVPVLAQKVRATIA